MTSKALISIQGLSTVFVLVYTVMFCDLYSVPFNGATNEGVVKKLLKEVTASNSQFQARGMWVNFTVWVHI